MFNDFLNDVQDAVQETTSNATSVWNDVAANAWDGVQSATQQAGDLMPNGAGAQLDLPNPFKFAEAGGKEMAKRTTKVLTEVGEAIQDGWNTLEGLPGLTVGGEGGIEVNGHRIGGEGGFEIKNPLGEIRREAEELGRNMLAGGKTVADTAEDIYSNFENAPDLELGANAGIEVNGHEYEVGRDVTLKNPLPGMRKEATTFGQKVERDARRLHETLSSLPGLSIFGEGSGSTDDKTVSADGAAGYDEYHGSETRVEVYPNKRRS